jgi:hypothetical protein
LPEFTGAPAEPLLILTMRYVAAALGLFLLLFGLGCLNYTKTAGLQGHTEFAIEHGLPKPSERILWCGAATIICGAGILGYLAGSRQKQGLATKPGLG